MIAILVSVVLGLIVNECSDVSPWCARKLVSWSAHLQYSDQDRARGRSEEWAAVIDARPGQLLKLLTALGFAGSAVFVSCRRTRLAMLIGRMSRGLSLSSRSSGEDAVSRYLDLLEGFVTALMDFEDRRLRRQDIPYRQIRLAVDSRCPDGSVYWVSTASRADLEQGARVELNENPGLRGVVTAASGTEICIRLNVSVARDSLPAAGSLRRTHNDRLCQMQREAIARLREGKAVNPQLIRTLADHTFLPFSSRCPAPAGTSRLNSEQQEAAARACEVQDLLLITSPPGTGRMHTTSEIISQCARRGERVLVISPTNAGLDNLLSAIPQDITKVRVARPGSLPTSRRDLAALNIDAVDSGSALVDHAGCAVERASVVAGTAARITLSGVTVGRDFDLLVIIDAERVSLPSAIAPLASARRAVLIGDPRQLPLFVDREMHDWIRQITDGDQDRPALTMEALLTTSLFELLLAETPSSNKVVLTRQYRMPSAVADFISHNFYDGTLTTSPASSWDDAPVSRSLLPRSFTIVDTASLPERRRGERAQARSYVNMAEADIIAAVVAAEDRTGRDWAVAVPYTAQAGLIRGRLQRALGTATTPADLEARVGTIDEFHGVEHDLVIVGCTRSNRSGSVGFLQDVRRFNVAMTRARRQLIVVGDMLRCPRFSGQGIQ